MSNFKYPITTALVIGSLVLSIGFSAQARPSGKLPGNHHIQAVHSTYQITKRQSVVKTMVQPMPATRMLATNR